MFTQKITYFPASLWILLQVFYQDLKEVAFTFPTPKPLGFYLV